MRKIDKIIIHCSATLASKDFNAKDIDAWHKKRGFKKIGYHYVIKLNGEVEQGRQEQETGAHCKGFNASSIGICYIGGLSEGGFGNPEITADTRTKEQKKSLSILVNQLKEKYPNAKVCGHNQFTNKACPCFDVTKEF